MTVSCTCLSLSLILFFIIILQAKSSSGDVYSWGIGECGELGRWSPPLKKKIGDEMDYSLSDVLIHVTPGIMYCYIDSSADTTKAITTTTTSSSQKDGKQTNYNIIGIIDIDMLLKDRYSQPV